MYFTKLYIIGNGFDLQHGIPSSPEEFKRFVQAKDGDVFDEVEYYLPAEDD